MNHPLLSQIADEYCTVRPLSRGGRYNIDRTIELYSVFLQRPATVGDFTDLAVSGWLQYLERIYSEWTRTGHRTRILGLWRFAARRKLCEPPGEVRRAPAPEPQPVAWDQDEVRRLLDACSQLPTGGRYFWALISAAYESGLRRGDLWTLYRDQIREDGVITIRQHKTGQPHVVAVRPETARAILVLPGAQPLACPWGSKKYTALWDKLRRAAGVGPGACQQLRRTGATWVAAEHGMDAARSFLGHRTTEMVRHYVDRAKAMPRPYMPPSCG